MKTEDITSYACGELTGAEREAFEAFLASSDDAQTSLRETTEMCDRLATTLPGSDDLGAECRAALLAACGKNLRDSRRRATVRKVVFAGSLTALAACLLIAPMLPWTAFHRTEFTPDVAWESAPAEGVPFMVESSSIAQPPLVAQKSEKELVDEILASAPLVAANAAPGTPMVGRTMPNVVPPAVVATPERAVAGLSAEEASSIRAFTGGWGKDSGTRPRQSTLQRNAGGFQTETYDSIEPNRFFETLQQPLSTFSIDVDTASYANVRRFLNDGQRPPEGAVRIEEMVNYFSYDYPQPKGEHPFSVTVDATTVPWADGHKLVRIGLKGRELPKTERPASNLVFLIDVSGSMQSDDKLSLLLRSLQALVAGLQKDDRVAIVVYAGASGLVLPSTPGSDKEAISAALDRLEAGGSTNGAAGIRLAYDTARAHFIKGGNNRVILCTDGDFNVGVTDQSSLVSLIEKERESGVFLSVLGFGTGNLKDSTMEKLANKGNGNYSYIDSLSEGRKVLVEQMAGTLFTIAKDVKIQVEFNPAQVAGYRLIGYENRILAKEDFNDDKKDAGEIGAGHTVTALYEIVPAGQPVPEATAVDPLKYQTTEKPTPVVSAPTSGEWLTVKLRYKKPDGQESRLLSVPFSPESVPAFEKAPADLQFAAAVAGFGSKLRSEPRAEGWTWDGLQATVRRTLGNDPGSRRAEFLTLIEKAKALDPAIDQ